MHQSLFRSLKLSFHLRILIARILFYGLDMPDPIRKPSDKLTDKNRITSYFEPCDHEDC